MGKRLDELTEGWKDTARKIGAVGLGAVSALAGDATGVVASAALYRGKKGDKTFLSKFEVIDRGKEREVSLEFTGATKSNFEFRSSDAKDVLIKQFRLILNKKDVSAAGYIRMGGILNLRIKFKDFPLAPLELKNVIKI